MMSTDPLHSLFLSARKLIFVFPALGFCFFSVNSPVLAQQRWKHSQETLPGNIKAFEENKGQYVNEVNNSKVLYACHFEGYVISFTEKGFIYSRKDLPAQTEAAQRQAEKQKEKEEQGQKREQEENGKIETVLHYLAMDWVGANPHPFVEALDKTPFYFCSAEAGDPAKAVNFIPGFQRLVYHDLYPGIDLEFAFHPDKGIKYTLRSRPGVDISVFSLHYSGQEDLVFDKKGNLLIRTATGNFLDHAPRAESLSGVDVPVTFEKLPGKRIGFKIGKNEARNGLILDPWLVSPSTGGFVPADIGMDATNNAYVYGMDTTFGFSHGTFLQKYGPTSTLLWTYTFSQYPASTANYQSDLAVDPAGNSYVASPYTFSNASGNQYDMVCIGTAGTQTYFYNAYASNNISETWNLAYSCNHSTLIQAGCGAGANNTSQVTIMTPSNGNVGQQYANTQVGEVYAGTVAPNGNYYALGADSSNGSAASGPYNNLLCCSVTGTTVSLIYKQHLDYKFRDFTVKSGPNVIGTNGIAAGCAYLYTSDGYNLDQRNLTTGALLKRVVIPGGSNGSTSNGGGMGNATDGHVNSGLAVDLACGYVYAGSTGGVYVFDANLNPVGSYASPLLPAAGIVYDLALNNGIVSVCGAEANNKGFVAQFNAKTCTSLIAITHTNASCGLNNGTATASPNFCVAPYTYLWTPSGQTTATATGLAPGLYTVQVSTQNSCASVSDTVTIFNSGSLTPVVTTTPTRCGQSNGSATVTVPGSSGPFTYSWNTVPPQTTPTITNLAAGTYTVTVTGASGCTGTAIAVVKSSTPGTLSITAHHNVSCNGGNNGSATATLTGGINPITYLWSPSGGNGPVANNLVTGLYTVTVKDSSGCTSSDTIRITQPAKIILITASTPSSCTGPTGTTSVTATGGVGTYTYSWSPMGGNASTASGLISGLYTVYVTDSNSCQKTATILVGNTSGISSSITSSINVTCYGGSDGSATVTVTGGHPPYSYSWSPAGALTAGVTGLTAGVYTATCKDSAGCLSMVTDTIRQPQPLKMALSKSNPSCNGMCNGTVSSVVTGGVPTYSYSWSGGCLTNSCTNACAGKYVLVLTDKNGCKTRDSIIVSQPQPLALVMFSGPAHCNNADGFDSVAVSGGTGPYVYSWSPGVGASVSAYHHLSPGSYTVTVIDSGGCKAKDTLSVMPGLMPTIKFSANDTVGCAPLCVTFSDVVSPACVSASWDFGDGTTGNGCAAIKHCFSYPGNFGITLQIKDINGCTSTLVKPNYIHTYPTPKAAFEANPQPASILSPTIYFTDLSTGAQSWSWNFGDFNLSTSSLQNPVFTYPDSGCYPVMLLVQNAYGCKDSITSPVCINSFFTFYAPNAFTPNGDGVNDIWTPKGYGIDLKSYHLMLFDRWGNLMFETFTWGTGWDGRANQGLNIAQIDTYVWRVTLKDYMGNKHAYSGICNLIK
jgi:gliding motility-associated-like protein